MPAIERVEVTAYDVPTVAPESDGTAEWDKTTLVVAGLRCGGETGLGYTYADAGTAQIAHDVLASHVVGKDPFDVPLVFDAMVRAVRNHGRGGACAMAISAIDIALWDLKAKINGEPLWRTLGASIPKVKAYASGIDMNLTDEEISAFYGGLAAQGVHGGKLKVGIDEEADERRLELMQRALAISGKRPLLMIDSNEYWSP
ncbi:MAG: mandelate racemase, partial [Myxococcales bacterium]